MPDPRWDEATQRMVEEPLHVLEVRIPNLKRDGCHCGLIAGVALRALADNGLLVTPPMAEVLERLGSWLRDMRQMGFGVTAADILGDDLILAVDAWEASREH